MDKVSVFSSVLSMDLFEPKLMAASCAQGTLAVGKGAITRAGGGLALGIRRLVHAPDQRLELPMMPSKNAKKVSSARTGAMTSTLRCFRVLELLAEEPFELSVSDIADILAMPRASAHRLCTTLAEGGLVEHILPYKRYRLTPKLLWVGSGYLRHSAIYRAAFFPMQELAKQIPGTAQLGVLSEGKVLFIHSVGYSGTTEAFAYVGLRRPLHATASGKLFLADMALDQVERLMSRGLKKFTERTTVSFAQMKEVLAEVKMRGYAVNDQELLPGYFVLAAPVLGPSRTTVGAISVTIPVEHINSAKEASHASLLCEAASKLSRR
jgi:DNA-binding IclR family transcriptional regulator